MTEGRPDSGEQWEKRESAGGHNDEDPGESGILRRLVARTRVELREQLDVTDDSGLDRDRLAKLAERLREAIDAALEVPEDLPLEIAGEVARLRAEFGESGETPDPVAISWNRTRQRAKKTAGVGAVTTIPAMIPILGPAVAALGLVADWRYVAKQQRDLVLEIAALFGVALEDPTREVRTLFVASVGAAFTGAQVGEAVGKALATQVARRSLSRVVPGVGAVVAASLNYVSTVAIGRAAIAQFSAESGVEVRGIVPNTVHPELARLRTKIIDAPQATDRKVGGPGHAGAAAPSPLFDQDDLRVVAELKDQEREELLDIALVRSAAASGDSQKDADRLISEVAEVLGFSAEEVEAARHGTIDDVREYAGRLAEIVGSATRAAGQRAGEVIGRAWRRVRRRGSGESPPDPS